MNIKALFFIAACVLAPMAASAFDPNANQALVPPDGFMVINGAVYKVTNGFAVVVAGNGVVRGVDGNPVSIPNGAMYTADGRLIRIPAGITGLPSGLNFRNQNGKDGRNDNRTRRNGR